MKLLNKCKQCGCDTTNPNYCSTKCSAQNVNKRRIYDSKGDNGKTKILNCPKCSQPFETYWRAGKYTLCKVCKRLPKDEKDLWGKKEGPCQFCQTNVTVKLLAPLLCKSQPCIDLYMQHRRRKSQNFGDLKASKKGGKSAAEITALKVKLYQILPWEQVGRKEKFRRIRSKGKCEICNNSEWMGRQIPLHIHHKTGPKIEDKETDLQLLCLNCHAQTSDFCFTKKQHKQESKTKMSQAILGIKRPPNAYRQITMEMVVPPKVVATLITPF